MSAMTVLVIVGITLAKFKPKGWYKLHPKLSAIGYIAGVIGFLIIFIAKVIDNRDHFKLLHEKLGLIALIVMTVTAVTGIFMNKLPKICRKIHEMSGWISLILVVVTIILGIKLYI